MQVLPTVLISALAAALIAPALQQTQPMTGPLLPDIPPTLTAANWTPDYQPYKITVAGGSSTYMGMDIQTLIMMSGFGASGSAPRFLGDASARWTRGEKTTINGQTFLVCYKAEMPGFLLTMRSPSLSGGTVVLELDLVKSDAIVEIQPSLGLNKDSFLEDAKDAGLTFADYPTPAILQQSAQISNARADRAKQSVDQAATLSNIKQLALGTLIYENDYDDLMPLAQSTAQVAKEIEPYIKTETVWKTLNPNGGRILFNTNLSAVNSSSIPDPAKTPMFFEQNAWPDGRRAVAYTDGHAKLEDQVAWQALQPLLHTKFPRGRVPATKVKPMRK